MTGPPFESHPSSGASIHARAEGLAVLGGGAHALSGDVRAAFAAAQDGVGGLLVGPMLSAPVRFYRTAARLHLGIMYAAGCLTVFANAVRDFDDGVDQLNAEWAAAVADHFGVDSISLDTVRRPYGVDQHALAHLQTEWATDVDLARRELAADLRARYRDLEARLDDAAHDVAGRLRHGPTEGGVRTMVEDGVFRQIYSSLGGRLDRLTPDQPSAIETLQRSGEPYICDGQGCRPAWPDMDGDGDAGPILGPIGSALDFLILEDLEGALNGDPSAVGWLALDVVGGPVGHALKTVKHADEVVELAHDAENAEDVLDAAEDAARIGHAGRHQFPGTLGRKSQFFDDVDLVVLSDTRGIVGFPQPNGNVRYVMQTDNVVGVERTTGLPTNIYTVIRKPNGDGVTMFPGTSPRS